MPSGTETTPYHTYAEARAAADFPSDEEFGVKSITIVDTDLHLVERVIGRLTMVKATLSGASSGALWGTSMGLMMFFASTNQSAFLWVLSGITGGALAGAFISGPLYVMTGGHRDFISQSRIVVSRYTALAPAGIDQVFELLRRSPDNQIRLCLVCRRSGSRGSGEYGSRPDEKSCFGVQPSDGGGDSEAGAPRDNERAAPAQRPAETTMEPAEDPRKPLD